MVRKNCTVKKNQQGRDRGWLGNLIYTQQSGLFGVLHENQDFIAPETDNVKQNLYAGFVGFNWTPNNTWNMYGGLRLESTNTDFRQNNVLREDLSKSYTDLLPNLGISFNSSIRMSLFYRASVSRPDTNLLTTHTFMLLLPFGKRAILNFVQLSATK